MTSIETAIWKVPSKFQLHWRSWDDEFVVYNNGSGDTHLLDPLAAQALQGLVREQASLSELTVKVANSLEIEPDSELSAYLERLLSDFYKLGLIERIEQ
jgi:PqqD family protein of HPr-rel-A system